MRCHISPRPDWVKSSPLSSGDANGYVEIDKHTMQHVRYPNVFSLGDAGSSPNSKTGAAIRKQAPVVVDNIDSLLKKEGFMYYPVKCSCCGKTAWGGCGQHVDDVMRAVPASERCICGQPATDTPKRRRTGSLFRK